jgi:hypothetical protein
LVLFKDIESIAMCFLQNARGWRRQGSKSQRQPRFPGKVEEYRLVSGANVNSTLGSGLGRIPFEQRSNVLPQPQPKRQARDIVKAAHGIGMAKAGTRKLVAVKARIGEQVSDLATVQRIVLAVLLAPGARFDIGIVDHWDGFPPSLAVMGAAWARVYGLTAIRKYLQAKSV